MPRCEWLKYPSVGVMNAAERAGGVLMCRARSLLDAILHTIYNDCSKHQGSRNQQASANTTAKKDGVPTIQVEVHVGFGSSADAVLAGAVSEIRRGR